MNGDEHEFPHQMFFEGIEAPENKTYVSLIESGPGIGPAKGTPLTLELRFSTGSSNFGIVACMPDDIEKLGKWLVSVSKEIQRREKGSHE